MHLSCGFAALSALFSVVSSSSLNFNLSIDYPPSSPLQIRQNSYFNEHHYYWINGLQPIWTTPQRRDVPQELRDQIDRAIAAVINLPHYFWTGTLPPNQTRADSVQWRTRPRARLEGGTTLEDALAGISMPEWTAQDAQAREIWTYASNAFANTTTGDAYVFRGEWWRSDSTFNNEEFHNLQANPSVPRIWEIRTHISYQEPPTLLWGNNDQAASNSKLRYQTSVACTIHASHGEFYRQQSETTTNYAEASPLGFFYGGQRSATNPGAYTYSMVSDAARDRPSQSTMSNWVTTHTSFDARFPTETSTLPSDINIPGIGWVPYQTACP
ncbi:hypothetical protein DL96DRAFT_10428 [Flagelloscypha sp. PMI_526]|nr:hypothetical protein DL96DRAFT_10428 [Flagelloscypha sp. PMI_526]